MMAPSDASKGESPLWLLSREERRVFLQARLAAKVWSGREEQRTLSLAVRMAFWELEDARAQVSP
jgi:hypothetical protein